MTKNEEIKKLAYHNYQLRLKAGMQPRGEAERRMWEQEDWKLAEMQYIEKMCYKERWGL